MTRLAEALARARGWPPERAMALGEAALLHDIGKIGIPERILLKPGPLTSDEYEQVKAHARLGCQIASEVMSSEQSAWILHHHERWDGAGYPDGLSGEQIPHGAQLLALADAWDAMTGARHYAAPLPPAAALTECESEAGRQFAPVAVDALRVVRGTVGEKQLTRL